MAKCYLKENNFKNPYCLKILRNIFSKIYNKNMIIEKFYIALLIFTEI